MAVHLQARDSWIYSPAVGMARGRRDPHTFFTVNFSSWMVSKNNLFFIWLICLPGRITGMCLPMPVPLPATAVPCWYQPCVGCLRLLQGVCQAAWWAVFPSETLRSSQRTLLRLLQNPQWQWDMLRWAVCTCIHHEATASVDDRKTTELCDSPTGDKHSSRLFWYVICPLLIGSVSSLLNQPMDWEACNWVGDTSHNLRCIQTSP